MTVTEIKDFIEQEVSFREEEMKYHETKVDIKDHINCLDQIKSMLDELDDRPKAKWEEVKFDIDIASRYECSNCHCLSHSKSRFCADCGARMNDEVDNGSAN